MGKGCFYGSINLTSIVVPDSVRIIETYAFESCENLSSVTFGKGLKYIGDEIFVDCPKLTRIEVSKENSVYYSPDNCDCVIEK